jgi:hypothetical protein
MKINSVGIQNYQQLNRQENNRPPTADRQPSADAQDSVLITPQPAQPSSVLSVKAPSGTYADALTPQERQALDLLFARFKESGRFTAAARSDGENGSDLGIGNIIDVKV